MGKVILKMPTTRLELPSANLIEVLWDDVL